jgi:CheY-like chemotaxis protein
MVCEYEDRAPLIVVVEDHALHARLLRRALITRLPKCCVELFSDGESASARLLDVHAERPALLVLDLDVPGLTGHELLAVRAADERLRRVPAVVVTSSVLAVDRERSLALGALLHIPKPEDADGFARLADELAALI